MVAKKTSDKASSENSDTSSTTKRRSQARPDRTRRAKEKFLEEFRKRGIVKNACEAAGIARRTAYDWHAADEDFAASWNEAESEAADSLEEEALRRAAYGTDKPITYQGVIMDHYKEYSDRMLEMMLRARRPERFSEKHQVDHSGGLSVSLSFDLSAGDDE